LFRRARLHAHCPIGKVLALVSAFCCLIGQTAYADIDYQLGHGLDIGPFNFAGYSNVVASIPNQGKKSLVLDDLSLFVAGHVAKLFNPFVEAELTHFDLAHTGPSGRDRGDGDFVLERFYNDSDLTDSTTLRLGKMLAPVGEWNQIHAAPLVLTTVRPAVTVRNFSEYATGVSILYSDPASHFPDLQVYWQPEREFSERPRSIVFHQYQTVEGAHVNFPVGLLDKVGVSFQQSRDIQGADQSLYGLDFHYTLQKLTLEGEGTFSDVSNNATNRVRDTEWGFYGAASYAFTDQWSLYSWYEEFADRTASSTAHDLLLGVAYKPHPATVLKLEYLQNITGQPVNPTGLFASWSVLF
jgi:hypothetical protein